MSRLLAFIAFVSVLATPTAAQESEPVSIPSAEVQEWQDYALTRPSYAGGTRHATATLYGNASRFDAFESDSHVREASIRILNGETVSALMTHAERQIRT